MFGKRKDDEIMDGQSTSAKKTERKVPELTTMVRTATGNRKYQQDAVYITKSKVLASNKKTRVLALVCDGMGGMADGGRASQTAIQMMVQGFQRVEKVPELNIPYFFQQGIRAIDRAIYEFPKTDGRGSGTTMAACIAEDNKLYWASVGDSWLHLQDMIAAGQMTMEEAMSVRQKEALISYLGMGNVSLMDINSQPFELQYGDVVMLCSDGITKTLPDEQIKRIITADAVKPEQKAEALVDAATHINSHSQDNTTVALIHYQEKDIKKIHR